MSLSYTDNLGYYPKMDYMQNVITLYKYGVITKIQAWVIPL